MWYISFSTYTVLSSETIDESNLEDKPVVAGDPTHIS